MKRILSFGAGKDSTAILILHLFVEDLDIDHVVFADTGAESKGTYQHIEFIKDLCADADLPFHHIARDGENIIEWCERLGIVPVMPGGSHICSKKFKGDVIQKWAAEKFNEPVAYLIGIEANETRRAKRFTPPKGDENIYEYPLIERGFDRDDCDRLLKTYGLDVPKSSCVFCPFMSPEEIKTIRNDPDAWQVVRRIEHAFETTSPRKHQAWIDAGKPLNAGGRAPKGYWRKDSWAEGSRLFVRKVDGRQLSVSEWETA